MGGLELCSVKEYNERIDEVLTGGLGILKEHKIAKRVYRKLSYRSTLKKVG